jgi:uncharacterized protein
VSICFLDAGFVIALEFSHDQHHDVASRCWSLFKSDGGTVVTTSFVLSEAVTHLNARGHHARAVRVGRQLMSQRNGEFVEVDHPLLQAGWNYFVRHQDKRYSLADGISFVVMEQRGLRQALTFDHHFAQAGFECVPG